MHSPIAMTAPGSRRFGLSLVEMLLAFAVMALTLIPLAGTFASGSMATRQIVDSTIAMGLAAEQLELMRVRPYGELATLPTSRPIDGAILPRGYSGTLSWREPAPGSLMEARARISWTVAGDRMRSLELSTLILNPRGP